MDAGHADSAYVCFPSQQPRCPPTAYSHGPEPQPRGHRAHNVGAVKRCPLIIYFPRRSAVNAKVVAAMAGSCPSSLFICGLPISCQTHTHLVALTGQVNTHAGSIRGNATAGRTVADVQLNINFNYRVKLLLIKFVFKSYCEVRPSHIIILQHEGMFAYGSPFTFRH